jgi:16S rRNA (guanine527-N7)-methyltransferase
MTDRLEVMLEQGIRELELTIPANAQSKLLHYLHLIVKWNKRFNLSGITSIQEMVPLHLLDSLAVSPFIEGNKILDIGSGAGLPGIPLAVVNPDKNFVLLDSNGKKTRFLFQVKVALELENVEVVNARVDEYFERCQKDFSLITCRAFSSLTSIVKMSEKPLSVGTQLLAMKGVYPHEEIAELEQFNEANKATTDVYSVKRITELFVPGIESKRHLVLIGRER